MECFGMTSSLTGRTLFAPLITDGATRYRHVGTAALLEEAETRRWEVVAMLADVEAGPTNWAHPASTLDYALTALEDVEAELTRRERLRTRPGAPPWPKTNARRLDELKAVAADLKRFWSVERYCADVLGMMLTKRGARLVASCPFPDHPDPGPSFTIGPAPTLWHCFGCGRGGDVFLLAGQLHGLDRFGDQLRHLADLAGVGGEEACRGR